MMKWLHLPWHVEGNRVIETLSEETLAEFEPGVIPVEQNRGLQWAFAPLVEAVGQTPSQILSDALHLITAAGYRPLPA